MPNHNFLFFLKKKGKKESAKQLVDFIFITVQSQLPKYYKDKRMGDWKSKPNSPIVRFQTKRITGK